MMLSCTRHCLQQGGSGGGQPVSFSDMSDTEGSPFCRRPIARCLFWYVDGVRPSSRTCGEPTIDQGAGPCRSKAMARHRIHSLAFKKQVVQEYAAGATLNALAREHDLSRTLIRIWIAKCESGEFDPDVEAATLLGDYEAKIATLERMVGRQAVEIEFLKGALQQGRSPRSAPMSVIAGPAVSPSLKDAG